MYLSLQVQFPLEQAQKTFCTVEMFYALVRRPGSQQHICQNSLNINIYLFIVLAVNSVSIKYSL